MAAAAALAAAAHVVSDTPAALRDWRQTLPLAMALGACAGWLAPPASPRAGLVVALLGLAAFAVAFALGHGAIEAMRGGAAPLAQVVEALARVVVAAFWPAGPVLLVGAAVVGWIGGARAPSRPRP